MVRPLKLNRPPRKVSTCIDQQTCYDGLISQGYICLATWNLTRSSHEVSWCLKCSGLICTNLERRKDEEVELLLSWALAVDVVGTLPLAAAAAAAAAIGRRAGSRSSRSLVCCTCCLSSCNCCCNNWSCDCMGGWDCCAARRTPDSWDRSSAIGSMLSRPDAEEEDEEDPRPLPPDPPKCILAARGRGGLGRLPPTAGWNKRLTCRAAPGSS